MVTFGVEVVESKINYIRSDEILFLCEWTQQLGLLLVT